MQCVAVGTIKSRANRARSKLAALLDLTSEAELGPDELTRPLWRQGRLLAPTPLVVGSAGRRPSTMAGGHWARWR